MFFTESPKFTGKNYLKRIAAETLKIAKDQGKYNEYAQKTQVKNAF